MSRAFRRICLRSLATEGTQESGCTEYMHLRCAEISGLKILILTASGLQIRSNGPLERVRERSVGFAARPLVACYQRDARIRLQRIHASEMRRDRRIKNPDTHSERIANPLERGFPDVQSDLQRTFSRICNPTATNIRIFNPSQCVSRTFSQICRSISKTKPRVRHLINVKKPHFLHFDA